MEAGLIPELQLISQLEKEIEREKQILEVEETQLNELTKNAAQDESSRRTQIKKVWNGYQCFFFCTDLRCIHYLKRTRPLKCLHAG